MNEKLGRKDFYFCSKAQMCEFDYRTPFSQQAHQNACIMPSGRSNASVDGALCFQGLDVLKFAVWRPGQRAIEHWHLWLGFEGRCFECAKRFELRTE